MISLGVPNAIDSLSAVSLMTAPPVLLIIFNRPDVSQRMFDVVQQARPAQLFIAADGPRPDHVADRELCARTRSIFAHIDWPCEVHRLYRDRNLGLTDAVISSITWFFEHVEAGMILEDDCLPTVDFFPFSAELLERYADTPAVMHISGLNMAPGRSFSPDSYFFTEVGHIWGWATWRRAWRMYDFSMADWPAVRKDFGFTASPLRRALGRKFASVRAGRKATWSRVWYFTLLRHQGRAIIPSCNFIQNVGFGADATHTRKDWHPLRQTASAAMVFPLRHPADFTPNRAYTSLLAKYHYGSYARRASELLWTAVDAVRRAGH